MTTKKTTGKAEMAAGVGIAGYGPNAIYHTETRSLRRKDKQLHQLISNHDMYRPIKPQPVKGPDGNLRGVPKEAKIQHTKDLKAHQHKRQLYEVERKALKPKIYPKQSKLWAASTVVGVPLAWHGARQQVNKSKSNWTKKDVDAAALGGSAGYGAYQVGAIAGSKPYEHRAARKIQENPQYKKVLEEHKQKALGDKRAPITTGDKSLRNKYFRKYPTNLPGGKFKRTVSWTHTGPTGILATAGVGALAASGAVHHERKRTAVKKNMSAFGIDHG